MNLISQPILTVDESKKIEPTTALVIHSSTNCSETFITRHAISNGALGLADVIDPLAVKEMFDEMTDSSNTKASLEILPQNVIHFSSKAIVWHTKRRKRTLFFLNEAIEIEYPPLLFIYDKSLNLSIYALPNNSRPHGDTRIYHAPLFNIYSSGVLCRGNLKFPNSLKLSSISLIEQEYFNSRCSHVNHDFTLKVKRGQEKITTNKLLSYWRKKSKAEARVKVSELNFAGTLFDILEKSKVL